MFIEYTQEEIEHARQLRERIVPSLANFNKLINEEANIADRDELIIQKQAAIDRNEADIEAFIKQCEQKRFAEIEKGGPAAIMESAAEQLPRLIEFCYNEAKTNTAGLDTETIKGAAVGTRIKNEFLLNPEYIAGYIKDELSLHIEAFQEDEENAQRLFALINEAIINSPLTDKKPNAKRDTNESPIARAIAYQRSPLARPAAYGILNDKAVTGIIANDGIFTEEANGQMALRWAINQAPKKAKKQIPVYISLTYTGDDLTLSRRLTAFDKAVMEAITTLYKAWTEERPGSPFYVSAAEVWRTMDGKINKEGRYNPSQAQINKIDKSIDKMRFTRIFMDLRQEIEGTNFTLEDERIRHGQIEEYLLPCGKITFKTEKNKTVSGYRLIEEPFIYSYNVYKKRVLFVPYNLLDTSDQIHTTEGTIEIRNYLAQQIQLMKNAKEAAESEKKRYFARNNTILIESIYKATGLESPEDRIAKQTFTTDQARRTALSRQRQADIEKISGILQSWKEKKWIKGFEAEAADGGPVRKNQRAKVFKISI